jgi:type II secretory pathway pseudopilin PulG
LIELIMVMLLIGVVATITVVSRPFSTDEFEQRGAYDEVVAAARYAQKLAITNRCTVRLTLNPTRFTITQSNTPAVCGTGADALAVPHPAQCRNPAAGTNYDCNTSAGVTISLLAGTSPVTFDSLGRTTDLTSRTVQIGTRTFTIVGASGFVQVPP